MMLPLFHKSLMKLFFTITSDLGQQFSTIQDYQPCTDPEALKELEGLDKVIAHFENLLENGVSWPL